MAVYRRHLTIIGGCHCDSVTVNQQQEVLMTLETVQTCFRFIQLSKPLCLLYYYICILENNSLIESIRKFTSNPLWS